MPITEAYMAPGDFRLTLRVDTPHLMETVLEFGHIIVVAQYPGTPQGFTDAGLLDAARYTGVVTEPEWRNGRMSVYGVGLDWWLGDSGIGPRLESSFSFTTDDLDTALTGMLAASPLTAGSIETSGSYSGSHEDQLVKDAITALCRSLDAHYRINPDFTVDGELVGTGSVFTETPTVVVVRENQGSDALWTGVPSYELISRRKARDYASRLLVGSEGSNTGVTRSTVSYYGPDGNTVSRVGLDSGSGAGSAGDYAAGWLADHDVFTEEQIRLDQYQIVPVAGGSTVHPGDVVYVWDPHSGFVDADNGPVWFRGQAIAPAALRVAEVEWPLVKGMGVYYRPAGASIDITDWIDLTPYVEWEGDARNQQSLLRVLAGTATTGIGL